mmetsp:Transcript_31237/g.38596  ORF Transcript_31237/g.38596 Transcript_31237/m.38596 type:complete len:213 (-) Transcript_31237:1021-1659(-)|eukprot:CAMPEP_0170463346 /NCGR_PEP_ID=MMETSP0123-20130129/8494_1 /TAXON_ID=182087 /ORGANISM="Favella ehrenbergii, Strain Fehren 1" /LENGTH=212 /DNA_ID=CAMNT_0010728759 /DNA_START=55 /DNA_END=693 /DNA_ORIENTATION=+
MGKKAQKLALLATLASLALAADYPRENQPCTSSIECYAEFEFCEISDAELSGVCEHKSLTPVNTLEIFGYIVTFIILLTSNMGGLGGGGAVIPICMVFFGFDTKQSIAQSNASIVIASLARYFFNFKKTHPYKNGHGILVDYNVASLMLPMITVGATVGVMFNKILPSVIIAIMLTVLLLVVSYMTLRKLLRIIGTEREKYGPVCGASKTQP